MTENEVLEILSLSPEMKERLPKLNEVYKVAVKALTEIQQYRSIGTLEQCRQAIEKQTPKIPDVWGDGYDDKGNMIYDMYSCPNCCENYEIDYHHYKYCPECGQAMNLDELE